MLSDKEVEGIAITVFYRVMAGDTERALALLDNTFQLEGGPDAVMWIAEKAEKIMSIAKIVDEGQS